MKCVVTALAKTAADTLSAFEQLIENGIDALTEGAKDGEEKIEEFYEMRNNALLLLKMQNEQTEGYTEYAKCFNRKINQLNLRYQIAEFVSKNADIMLPDEIMCYEMSQEERDTITKRQTSIIAERKQACEKLAETQKKEDLSPICRELLNSTPEPKKCPQYLGGKILQKMFPECYFYMEDKIEKFKQIVNKRQQLSELAADEENYDLSPYINDDEDAVRSISDVPDNDDLINKCEDRISFMYENAETLLDDGQTFGKCENDNAELCEQCREDCADIESEFEDSENDSYLQDLQNCRQKCQTTCNTHNCCQQSNIKNTLIKQKYTESMRNDIETFNQNIADGVPLYRALIDFDLRAALSFEKNNNNILNYNQYIENCTQEQN